ncbi:MAG: SLC13 family permease, partial [Myxococcales bacterium]|nr:SLC13 family permease [Myxococcales bacterium]
MGWEALLAIGVAVGVLVALATDRLPAELVVLGGLVVLLVSGVLTPQAAFAGFANPGVIALAGLYVLTAALRETG